MAAVPVLCRYPLTTAWMVATVAFGASAFGGQGMRFFPIRVAPLGSDVGTVGDPVTPQFNEDLGCWELQLPAGTDGFEVDLDLQVFGWGMATGSPKLGAIQATMMSAGFNNGSGVDLNPKGWPASPLDGAYQANRRCEDVLPDIIGNLDPCVPPFDTTCDNFANGVCVHASNWVMPPCANGFGAIVTSVPDYAWGMVAQVDCNEDDGQVKTLGGLILEVPVDAAGTYMIDFDRDPNNSFMSSGSGPPIPGVVFTPACITLVCQSDADCNRDDGISCTTDTCDEGTSTCENIIAPNSCLIDNICYANGQADPAESCRLCTASLSQTDWSNRFAGFACGTATDTECDNPNTCDGFGACLDNFEITGTPCGVPTDSDCDHPNTCDGAGSCGENEVPNGTACTDDGNDCTSDFCTNGRCRHPFSDAGTRCGDATDTPCDAADTCDGSGNCLNNVLPDEAPCPNGNFCDGAELCLGGVCQSAEPPCDVEDDLCDEQDDECDLLGDFDGDLLVTQSDFSHWPDCETGPMGGPYAVGCEIFDFEQNAFVDLRDYARFQSAFTMP